MLLCLFYSVRLGDVVDSRFSLSRSCYVCWDVGVYDRTTVTPYTNDPDYRPPPACLRVILLCTYVGQMMSLVQQAIVARCLLVVALEGAGGVSRRGGGEQEEVEGKESDGAAAAVDESLATRVQVHMSPKWGCEPERRLHGVCGVGCRMATMRALLEVCRGVVEVYRAVLFRISSF